MLEKTMMNLIGMRTQLLKQSLRMRSLFITSLILYQNIIQSPSIRPVPALFQQGKLSRQIILMVWHLEIADSYLTLFQSSNFCLEGILLFIQSMEYQLKKEQILNSVEYSNLLTFSLVQNKLERNFKSIVEALLLNQSATDQLITKTDHLQDRLALGNKQNNTELDAVKQLLKEFDQRISRIEGAHYTEAASLEQKNNAYEETKTVEREDSRHASSEKMSISLKEPPAFLDKSNLYDKKLEQLEKQVAYLKERLPGIQLMQNQLDNMKRQFTGLKGEFITFNNKSNKSLKRESIANNLSNVGNNLTNLNSLNNASTTNLKRDSMSRRGSTLVHSNSNVVLGTELANKENKEKEGEISLAKIEGSPLRSEVDFQKEIEGLHVQVNTLNLCYEELKVLVDELSKKDIKHFSQLLDLEDKHKKMQSQSRKDFQNLEKQLKTVQISMLNAEAANKQSPNREQSSQHRSPKAEKSKSPSVLMPEETINWKNQLNDKLSKIHASLQGFITETEFNRFKNETRDKLEELEKKHGKLEGQFQEQIKKIYDMLINKDLDINRLKENIDSIEQVVKENNLQADRKHNIAIARIEELKKNVQNLREDVEFYQSMNAQTKEKKTSESEKPNEKELESTQKEKNVDTKAVDDLKRYFNNKMHDQRAYLVGLVRDLEKKQAANNGYSQEIANIWDKINEIGLFLGKKADADDTKKNLIFLQKKISRLGAHIMKSEDNTEDARVARTNWFCLSCDKNLLGYQGKIGRHVVWDQMPLKGTMKATIEKKGLPSLKSK